jgi:hypothetical protein
MNPFTLVNPVTVARTGAGLAGTAVGLASSTARAGVRLVAWGVRSLQEPGTPSVSVPDAPPEPTRAASTSPPDTDVPPGPSLVAVEPHAPEAPPVDVVGQALAADRAQQRGDGPDGDGLAHEPRGASRDEEHGVSELQRAEVEEIAEETAAALEGDPEPPEPPSAPLVDPAETKAAATELRRMSRAADPDQG